MSYSIKLALAKKLSQALKVTIAPCNVDKIVKCLSLSSKNNGDNVHYSIPISTVQKFVDIGSLKDDSEMHLVDKAIVFPLSKSKFLEQSLKSGNLKSQCRNNLKNQEKVIVEFSSPNIVKPFHIGHFRGTVLGNFVANLSEYFSSDVVRLNYLGDWGTQFGLIQIGLKELNKDGGLDTNVLDTLYKAYVNANQLGKTNPDIQRQASDIFEELEKQADFSHVQDWRDFRQVTVEELRVTYERLGVYFDEYNWESDYSAGKISHLISRLSYLPQVASEGAHLSIPVDGRTVTLLKSNGSTMYLTRDIAAAIDRYDRYHFSKMFYVTDLSQENHFKDLIYLLKLLDHPCCENIEHVRYGKILGMSTREGQGVFLKDLLDEARDRMYLKQKETKSTRVSLDDTNVSDILGMSSLIVYQLKTRRLKNSHFNWDECLHMSGDGGVKLQYCHARLMSLLESGVDLPDTVDIQSLQEPIAVQLILDIASFHDALCLAQDTLESAVVVKYLFGLCNNVNKALKLLQVKGSERHVAEQRLLLFSRAREVLSEGLCLLGIKPLDKM